MTVFFATFFLFTFNFLLGQGLETSFNPISNLITQHKRLENSNYLPVNIIYPNYNFVKKSKLNISYSSINFYNSGFNNLNNNGELIAYPSISNYLNYSFLYYNNFILLKFSPLLTKAFNSNDLQEVGENFSYLNDKRNKRKNNGFLNQSTLAVHFNGIGFGVSNESMWFGPGFHSSLSMSNNAPGFKNYFIGTLEKQRFKNFGFNFRYFVSERSNGQNLIYHTALASTLTYYNNPTITIGFNRTYLSGGDEKVMWTINDAALLVFEPLFGDSKKELKYVGNYEGEPEYWDKWDQLLVGYINIFFKKPKINFYIELGTDDSRANFVDLRAHWDHAIGYVIGYKKYGLLGNPNIFIGMETMSNRNTTNTLNDKFYRGDWDIPNFYNRGLYLHSSYEGRRWGAHSGSDSIDKIIMLGLIKNNFSIISSFNFERRGVISQNFPEKKYEVMLLLKMQKKNIGYTLYFENEKIYNYNFNKNYKPKNSNVIGLGIVFNFN